MKHRRFDMVYADEQGNVYDYPGREPVFRSGNDIIRVRPDDLIPLPEGSYLYYLPGRRPLYHDLKTGRSRIMVNTPEGGNALAVSAFLSSGYLRTALPAYKTIKKAPVLPLWGYCGAVFSKNRFYVPGMRIDPDPRSDPGIHQNARALAKGVRQKQKLYPENRLIRQLSVCSTDYGCLCARNFFLQRYEVPVPTSPACNARCLGCLSHQEAQAGFVQAQPRLAFKPAPEEITQVILHHFTKVDRAVASFGQGCEGEPLLRASDLAKAIAKVREKTDRGTININTNGSDPAAVKRLINAGLDSIRISLNSPTETYYTRYHQPVNYDFADVIKSIAIALEAGIFVSLNLFFMPGFTDMETEAAALFELLERFPVHMIQTRNLNIDPDFYFNAIGYQPSPAMGISRLIAEIRSRYPAMRLGYYNPPKETFAVSPDPDR
jgi:pyruvate-formate lyase-activating enzyme